MSRIRVFIATSLDGFIAGPGGDLSWLPETVAEYPTAPGGPYSYDSFMENVGALLMGRTTYDTVRGFDVPWPYGDTPVLVATHRALDEDPPESVTAVSGSMEEMIAAAKAAAAGKDVYLDGGSLIGQAAQAGLLDEIIITRIPVALGSGHPLFGPMAAPFRMRVEGVHQLPGGLFQVVAVPAS